VCRIIEPVRCCQTASRNIHDDNSSLRRGASCLVDRSLPALRWTWATRSCESAECGCGRDGSNDTVHRKSMRHWSGAERMGRGSF
jgi:hypothetical protein